MAFVIARNDFNQLRQLIVWFFLCPQLIRILLVFLLRIHWIASRWSTFQGVSRNVDVILVKDFANSIDVLIWQSFLFWNQILHFKNHVYSKSSCWNEIREISVLEKIFWKSSFFDQRSNTCYSKYAILWLSCILKTEMIRCKIKMTFFMVLCVSFNLWSWVSHLMVCDEVTFCEFQETKGSSQNLRIYQEMVAFFF